MRFLTITLLALIAISVVKCTTDEEKLVELLACQLKLTNPTCVEGSCETAWKAYKTCIKCPNSSTVSSVYSCGKDCDSTLKSASSDSSVATFVDAADKCYDALNGSLLALSGLLLSIFALLF